MNTWLAIRGNMPGAIFTNINKADAISTKKLTAQAIFHILKMLQIKSECNSFSPHDLRRTFATKLLDMGADIFLVKKAMGHSDISTTEKYDKRDDEKLKQTSERINFAI